ncbi:MAG: helix-turn-helix transcriptional regulator [Verrucomicrobia bacterium]|nr:helix-turn-helix transcriptional regulator [Verrucomicrobiota bacterium]
MDLREYLDKKKITYGAFAETLGVHEQTIKNIACGIRKPGLKLALRIEELSEGNVTPRELIDSFENGSKTTFKRKSFRKNSKIN